MAQITWIREGFWGLEMAEPSVDNREGISMDDKSISL
jgi:hypothetical protein